MKKPKLSNREKIDHPLAKCAPRGDRVVVRRDISKKKTTAGGILLPDSFANAKQQTGVVYAVGPGRQTPEGKTIPLGLEIGQHVIITGWAGLEIADPLLGNKDDEFVLLRDEDVVAVLPD